MTPTSPTELTLKVMVADMPWAKGLSEHYLYIVKVLDIFSRVVDDATLGWGILDSDEYGKVVEFSVNCGKVFHDASQPDGNPWEDFIVIRPDDIPLLSSLLTDLEVIKNTWALGPLFAACKRRQCPPRHFLDAVPPVLRELFYAAGT